MKRILVCEDEEVIRDFVVINLKRAGYDVIDVSCGEDALRVFDEENGNFDIALLDIMMPGLDGWQVCREIRKTSNVPIIMITAPITIFTVICSPKNSAPQTIPQITITALLKNASVRAKCFKICCQKTA